MRAALLMLVALSLAGCAPATLPTQAVIAKSFDDTGGRSFLACQVKLGWTYAQLIDWCGPPDATMKRAKTNGAGYCYFYETRAVTFVAGTGAQGYVVCTMPRTSGGGFGRGETTDDVVDIVIAVDGAL